MAQESQSTSGKIAGASVQATKTAEPIYEISASRTAFSPGVLKELWQFREVLWAFTLRQVKVRYKQAAVGIGWAVIQPVASAILFAIFLGRLAHVPSEGTPYLLFALAGLVAWTYFSAAVGNGMESIIQDQAMVRKVYFPREILPLANTLAAIVDLCPALVTLFVAAVLFGIAPSVTWLLVPLAVLLLVLPAMAVALALSALNVYYRDVRHGLPFVLQVGLFASPVVYSVSLVPRQWRLLYTVANPVAAAIDTLRRVLVHRSLPDPVTVFASLAWSLTLFFVCYYLFKRLERGFADRL